MRGSNSHERVFAEFEPHVPLLSLVLILATSARADGCNGPAVPPLDEHMPVTVGDVRLEIPFGYIEGYPSPHRLRGPNVWDTLSFEFWMPCRRYMSRGDRFDPLAGFRPREQRPSDAHLVRITTLRWAYDHPTPAQQFLNRQDYLTGPDFRSREAFGLVRYWNPDDPEGRHEIYYRHPEGSEIQVFLHCSPPALKLPNPVCAGDVLIEDELLSFFIYFAYDALPKWRETVEAVGDLAESWRVDP